MALKNQVSHILEDLEHPVILGDQIPPLFLGSQVDLLGRLCLVSPPPALPKVLVGLYHLGLLQLLVLLEDLVFLGSLVALETHSVLVFRFLEGLPGQEPQMVHSAPLSQVIQEVPALSLPWGLEDQASQGSLSAQALRILQVGLVSPAPLLWTPPGVQVGLAAPEAQEAL